MSWLRRAQALGALAILLVIAVSCESFPTHFVGAGGAGGGGTGGAGPTACQNLNASCGKVTDPASGKTIDCGSCPAGLTCGGGAFANQCAIPNCIPKTCADLGAQCGTTFDGCGATIVCPTCPSGQTCGGGGAPNLCGTGTCTPKSCSDQSANCGALSDGCGGVLLCGTCATGLTCGGGGTPNKCGVGACTPAKCAAGLDCGLVSDGCGGVSVCGTGACKAPTACGGSGKANQCGCTKATCAGLKLSCGSPPDGCGGTLSCGMCGTGQLCGTTGMCAACTQNAPCMGSTVCKNGTQDCSGSTPTCKDSNKPAGTSCGTGQVCDGNGACVLCAQGASCTTSTPCKQAQINCSTGAPVCKDGNNLPPGTSCGTAGQMMICSPSGTCITCTPGSPCGGSNPCTNATLSCAGGMPTCNVTSYVSAGTSCGTNLVCNGSGGCVSCTPGASCNPPNPCYLGTTSCSTGTPVCNQGGPAPQGTPCGSNMICNGSGSCVTNCPGQGQSCSYSACATGLIGCPGGGPATCTNPITNLPAGTSCGTSRVCDGLGNCNFCNTGDTCSVGGGPCTVGHITCNTGSQVCTPSSAPAGTACDDGNPCTDSDQCNGSGGCAGTPHQPSYQPGGGLSGVCVYSAFYCSTTGPQSLSAPPGYANDGSGVNCGYNDAPNPATAPYSYQENFCAPCPGGDCTQCP